ncbi:FlgO family outer membrane protein [Thalassotalea sp. SU-HH00458]|uniref:FlgO family outer membrane protein n=1 Tax=Thalassotalea sp. SU-HH00458 TaxID=3127657 RepID=UPI003108AD86
MSTKILIPLCIALISLTGCAYHHHDRHWAHQGKQHNEKSMHNQLMDWQLSSTVYRPRTTHKLLSDYTEVLAMKLIENMKYVSDKTPIAITSFVELDNNLQTTNILGNQLAESFMNEMQEFGLSVVDVNHMGKVVVTPSGDFSFSRDGKELGQFPELDYVLSGTLTYNTRGVIINARIVGVDSKVVVSSAKGFIPHFIVESLHPSYLRDGINLTSIR